MYPRKYKYEVPAPKESIYIDRKTSIFFQPVPDVKEWLKEHKIVCNLWIDLDGARFRFVKRKDALLFTLRWL